MCLQNIKIYRWMSWDFRSSLFRPQKEGKLYDLYKTCWWCKELILKICFYFYHSLLSLKIKTENICEKMRERDSKSNLQGQDGSFWNVEIQKDTTSFPYFHCTGYQYWNTAVRLVVVSFKACWLLNVLILNIKVIV